MSPAAHTIDKELCQLIAEGDETAFTSFFNFYYPKLRPFAVRFFKEEQLAEDAIQETFIRVWLNRDELPQIENIDGWINTILSRVCLNTMRNNLTRQRHNSEAYSLGSGESPTPLDHSNLNDLGRAIAKAVDQLPDARKQIYQLSRVEGRKPAQIAEMLGISVSTVKNALVIAVKQVREFLLANGYHVSLLYLLVNYF